MHYIENNFQIFLSSHKILLHDLKMLSRKYQRKRRKCSNCCIALAALKLLFTTFVGCSLCPWMCINGWKTSGKRFVFLWLKKRYKNAGHLPFCLVWPLVYLNFSTYSLKFFFPLTFQLNYWQFRFVFPDDFTSWN